MLLLQLLWLLNHNATYVITIQIMHGSWELRFRYTYTPIVLYSGSMQMSMRKLNSHTILQLWCCCHVMYKLLS